MRKCVLCHNNKGADQPAHLRSLISAFAVRYLDSIISRFYSWNFKTLPSFYGCTGQFVSFLVRNSRRYVCHVVGHIYIKANYLAFYLKHQWATVYMEPSRVRLELIRLVYMLFKHLCVYLACVTLFFSLPPGVRSWLQIVIVALPGLFILLFSATDCGVWQQCLQNVKHSY